MPGTRRLIVDRSGTAYVLGATGTFAVLSKISSSGRICWTKQISTSGGVGPVSVTTDHCSNVYVAGTFESQRTVAKFDADGNLYWQTHLNNEAKTIRDIAVDHCGRIVVIGNRLDSMEPFIQRLTQTGVLHSDASFSDKSQYRAWRLAIDGKGAMFVAGSVGEPGRLFLAKIDDSLRDKWWHWLSDGAGFVKGLEVDRCGNALVSGNIDRSIHGQPFSGKRDIFVMKLKP